MRSNVRLSCDNSVNEFSKIVNSKLTTGDLLYVGVAGDPKGGEYSSLFKNFSVKTFDIDQKWGPDIVGDITKTTFSNSSWDVIVCVQTIEHIPNIGDLQRELYRILRPGGYALIDCPWNYPHHPEDGFKDYWRISKDGLINLFEDMFEIVTATMDEHNSACLIRKRPAIRNFDLVSCILPTYNRSERLKTRINEIISQTYFNWELIIVDDGSTDDTVKIVEPYLRDVRIKYKKLHKNSGSVSIPRNVGISWSTGKYICHIDDDVVQRREKLEKLVSVLDDVECVLAFGQRINYTEQTGERNSTSFTHWNPFETVGIDTGQIMYRSSVYESVPLVFCRRACDWELAKAIHHLGKFNSIPDIVCEYIWHGKNRSLDDSTKEKVIHPTEFKEEFNPNTKYILDLKDV